MRVITCKSCGVRKYEDKFYVSNKASCKECVKARATEYRWANLDKVHEYDRGRGQLEHRREDKNVRRLKYEAEGRMRSWRSEWNDKNPHKKAAHAAVRAAIKSGTLTRPSKCDRCSRDYKIHAHHDDYSNPLDVMWLCAHCHGERHRELNAVKRMAAE